MYRITGTAVVMGKSILIWFDLIWMILEGLQLVIYVN